VIFVDTSIWIDYFHGKNPELTKIMLDLLEDDMIALPNIVMLELLTGTTKEDFSNISRLLHALPIHKPSELTWTRIEDQIRISKSKGEQFSLTDLIIASITFEEKGKLWSKDKDFIRMQKLGFVKLFNL